MRSRIDKKIDTGIDSDQRLIEKNLPELSTSIDVRFICVENRLNHFELYQASANKSVVESVLLKLNDKKSRE